MYRRKFLKGTLTASVLSMMNVSLLAATKTIQPFRRVRPGDAGWPSPEKWEMLNKALNGSLLKIESPLTACSNLPHTAAYVDVLKELNNPYYLGDEPALTQTSGWIDAWKSSPSVYAVAAKTKNDIITAVNFARENELRLVVKGGGHSYQGTSNSADSLLVWTRHMNKIELHDDFVATGCEGKETPQPAATIEAGAIWMQVYDAVTVKAGKYIQGGGCATVGVAGLVQSGGFGSFSKNFGLAASALLEAEIVTASGQLLLVNKCNHSNLFWALKGGGGGSFGVVTKVTLRTRQLPETFGAVFGKVKAISGEAFRKLIAKMIAFYHDHLFNSYWGEQIHFYPDNNIGINMVFQGLNKEEANEIWKPLLDWINNRPESYTWIEPLTAAAVPARHFWDADFLSQFAPALIVKDDRPGAPKGNILWAGDKEQAGWFLHGFHSAWLSAELLENEKQKRLVDALYDASRYWSVSLHFNKGLAGAPEAEIIAAKDTAINPAVISAFALAIIAGGGKPAFQGIPVGESGAEDARQDAEKMNKAQNALSVLASKTGSYVSESNFFEKDWQVSFWGINYSRLASVKKEYDPEGLFFIRHGVGSEEWSDDGFTRLPESR